MTTSQERLPAREARDPETTAGLARAAMFRELDRALDEVRLGLALDAWDRRAERRAPGRRRDVRPS